MARNDAAPPRVPGWPLWLTGTVLAGCAALVALAVFTGPYPAERGQRLLVAFVICSPIVALRRWPLPVLAVAAAVNVVVMAGGDAPVPFAILLGFAAYLVASRLPRRTSMLAAGPRAPWWTCT